MATAADGLGAALQRPAVALVVAALLLLGLAWAFQRLWLMLLAWWPGPVRVHDIAQPPGAVAAQPPGVRRRARAQGAPRPAPAAAPPGDPAPRGGVRRERDRRPGR